MVHPLFLKTIASGFSFKNELRLVFFTFLFTLSLPVLILLTLTNTGITLVSNKLASIQANTVTLYSPTGKVSAHVPVSRIWPVQGIVTLEFGESDLPYQPFHTGIDIASKIGDPVTPFMKGKVVFAGEISWGYGKYVVIDHSNNVTSIYAHLNEISVTKGQEVQPGDIIGQEGKTGWATGPHVHFEVRVLGLPVNPRTFIQENP